MEKISVIEIKLFNPIENIKTIGNYSEEGNEKYKKKIIDANRFGGKFQIENTEEDMIKKINKNNNYEKVVNDN
jgi:hypothetical protein